MKNYTQSALLLIDMERGFIDRESIHCIAQAEAMFMENILELCAATDNNR